MLRLSILTLSALVSPALFAGALTAQQFADFTGALPDMTAGLLGPRPNAAVVGDIDGDGDIDAIVAVFSFTGSPVFVLKNDGTGRFAIASTAGANSPVVSMAIGDLDGDGDLDFVTGGGGGGSSVQFNDGSGNFTPRGGALPQSAIGNAPIDLADLDGDGDLDLLAPRSSGVDRIYFNDGLGRFSASPSPLRQVAQFTVATCAGDIDGDGDLDLVMAGSTSNQPTLSGDGLMQVQRNDGGGHFVDVSATSVPAGFTIFATTAAALADFDGDGDLDFVIIEPLHDTLLLNDGSGVFQERVGALPSRPLFNNATGAFTVLDYDEDGDLDLLSPEAQSVRVLENDGQANFIAVGAGQLPAIAGQPNVLIAADFDDDGDADAMVLRASVPGFVGPSELWVNRRRHLRAVSSATIGARLDLEIAHRPSVITSQRFAIPYVATGRARLPIGALGVLGLSPASMVALSPRVISAGADAAVLQLPVPARPSLVGQSFAFQALIVNANGAPLRLTNTAEVTVGQ